MRPADDVGPGTKRVLIHRFRRKADEPVRGQTFRRAFEKRIEITEIGKNVGCNDEIVDRRLVMLAQKRYGLGHIKLVVEIKDQSCFIAFGLSPDGRALEARPAFER